MTIMKRVNRTRMIHIKKFFNLGSGFRGCATAPGCFDFEAVKLKGIVRGCDHYAADGAELLDTPGNNRCRLCFAKESDTHSITRNDLGCAFGKILREKTAVIADHH